MSALPFAERAKHTTNAAAKILLQLMDTKETNLCVSADLTRSDDLLKLANQIGPEICLLKTHIDTLEDFSDDFINQLVSLSKTHNFLIFEDRKFADIGNTVKAQYGKGVYRIADWAHITNAHILPGEGIINGLKSVGLEKGNGLLLLAQMSSAGNLLDDDYAQAAVKMARAHKEFVMGFITQHQLTDDPALINFTPGINSAVTGDTLGQQYVTPEQAILKNHTDVIIVGRGIYAANNPVAAAKSYRSAAWRAYQTKITNA
jgi:uridine monophosphate synthetase